jgi:hypothetical protein
MEGLTRRETMADEPRKNENQEAPAEPRKGDDIDPRSDTRNKSDADIQEEVIDDDRFQATDN